MKNFFQIIILLMLTACQTGTGQIGANYTPYVTGTEFTQIEKLKKWQTPTYYYSTAPERDIERVVARGYVILGTSRFSDTAFSLGHAANQAVKIGATHIIYGEAGNFTDQSKINSNQHNYPVAGLLGFASAPPLSGIDIDNIMTGSNSNNSYTYQQYYYDNGSPNLGIIHHFESYFFAKSVDHHLDFGLSIEDYADEGAKITSVKEGSVSDALGLQKNDIITAINGQEIRDSEHAADIIENIDELSEQTSLFITRNGDQSIAVIPAIFGN